MCPAPVECRPDRSDAHRFGAIPPADTARGGTPTGTRSSPRSGAPGAAPATLHSRPPKGMEKLPAFIRDTDLNLHFRTFYFDRINPDDSVNEAWAIGGWLEYGRAGSGTRSPWGRSGIPPSPYTRPTTRTGPHCSRPARKGSPCSARPMASSATGTMHC